jgi:hypothetical protein
VREQANMNALDIAGIINVFLGLYVVVTQTKAAIRCVTIMRYVMILKAVAGLGLALLYIAALLGVGFASYPQGGIYVDPFWMRVVVGVALLALSSDSIITTRTPGGQCQ